jgi:hypothetical protein
MRAFAKEPSMRTARLVPRLLVAVSLVAACGDTPPVTDDAAGAPPDLATASPPPDLATAPDLAAPPDLLPAGPCNPVAQNCPDPSKKCTVTIGTRGNENRCLPINGMVATGQPCMRDATNMLGHDNCDKGNLCSPFGAWTATLDMRRCRAYCRAQGDCPQGYSCMVLGQPEGICVPSCTPFGSECPNGFTCSDIYGSIDEVNTVITCRAIGAIPVGSACTDTSDCVADSWCNSGLCLALCDATHPCPAGKSCRTTSTPGLPNMAAFCE